MKSAPVLLTLSDSKHVVLPVDDDSDLNVVAAFDRRGEFIYTGNAKGKVSATAVISSTVYCLASFLKLSSTLHHQFQNLLCYNDIALMLLMDLVFWDKTGFSYKCE